MFISFILEKQNEANKIKTRQEFSNNLIASKKICKLFAACNLNLMKT